MARDWGGECPLRKQVTASTSEEQGRHREVRSGGRVEQTREPTNRNRISGVGGGLRANRPKDCEALAIKEPGLTSIERNEPSSARRSSYPTPPV
jgi:hypothetical protein